MSDGISDANRAGELAIRIEHAAKRLAHALDECYDAAFGYNPDVLKLANEQLRSARLRLVTIADESEEDTWAREAQAKKGWRG